MAKLTYTREATKDIPAITETIEVRVWGLVGSVNQPFYIGSGGNSHADYNFWLEFIYTVEGIQIFYTRNFLQHTGFKQGNIADESARLNEVVENGGGRFGFSDMLPETSIYLTVDSYVYEDPDDIEKHSTSCQIKISADTSAVFGRSGPGDRFISIESRYMEVEQCAGFMRDLIREMDEASQGCHPNPASYPPGSSEWPFVWELNRRSYDEISAKYQEHYFANPLLVSAFDSWVSQLPAGAAVLDAGCGHGKPVIGCLLEKGFKVTGTDFSPKMLTRAASQYPQVDFLQLASTQLSLLSAFDGICSFNSIVYLDLIDLLNSIHHLYHALKPGGLLFLYGYDSGPSWRGEPLGHRLGQWMWSWHYGMEEMAVLLEEHGYFKVLEVRQVTVDPEEAQRIEEEEERRKQEEEIHLSQAGKKPARHPSFSSLPIERSAYAYAIIARRLEH